MKRQERIRLYSKYRELNQKPKDLFTTGFRYGVHPHYLFVYSNRVFGDDVDLEEIANHLVIKISYLYVCKHRVALQITCGACHKLRPSVQKIKDVTKRTRKAVSIDFSDEEDDLEYFVNKTFGKQNQVYDEVIGNPDLDNLIENQDEFLKLNQNALSLFMQESKALNATGFLHKRKDEIIIDRMENE